MDNCEFTVRMQRKMWFSHEQQSQICITVIESKNYGRSKICYSAFSYFNGGSLCTYGTSDCAENDCTPSHAQRLTNVVATSAASACSAVPSSPSTAFGGRGTGLSCFSADCSTLRTRCWCGSRPSTWSDGRSTRPEEVAPKCDV